MPSGCIPVCRLVSLGIFVLVAAGNVAWASDRLPQGWTRLHLAAVGGEPEDILGVLAKGHWVDEPTDNREKKQGAYLARMEALDVLRDARKDMLRPIQAVNESEKNYRRRVEEWRNLEMGWIEWRGEKAAVGTYLQALARVNRAILSENISTSILAFANYERCLHREWERSVCEKRRSEDVVERTVQKFEFRSPIVAPPSVDVYTPYLTLLAEVHLASYQACVKRESDRGRCTSDLPPVTKTWKHVGGLDVISLSSPTPRGILELVQAEEWIRTAERTDGATALGLAAGHRRARNVRALLDQGADPTIRSSDGTTPLHWAAESNDEESIRYLLKSGADVDARNVRGYTPLHVAVAHLANRSASTLLEYGADANAESAVGETPLWMSILLEAEGRAMRDLLENSGGKCGRPCQGVWSEAESSREFHLRYR